MKRKVIIVFIISLLILFAYFANIINAQMTYELLYVLLLVLVLLLWKLIKEKGKSTMRTIFLLITIIGLVYFSFVLYKVITSSFPSSEELPVNMVAKAYMKYYVGDLFTFEAISIGELLIEYVK